MGEQSHAPQPRRRIIDEHIDYEDGSERVTSAVTELAGSGDTARVSPVDVAVAETNAAREAVDQLILRLRPVIGDDLAFELDEAITCLEGAVRGEMDSRVLSALYHDSGESSALIIFERFVGERDES